MAKSKVKVIARYCGRVRIGCRLVRAPDMPHGEQYKCSISIGGRHLGYQYVGLSRHLTHAIDSPREYDSAARAALAFAMDEEERGKRDWEGVADQCDYTRSGNYHIRRKK